MPKQALLYLTLTLFVMLPFSAQARTRLNSDWEVVRSLPVNSYIHIQARPRHTICTLKSVDADTLTCERDTGTGIKLLSFQRTEIQTIKLAHRGRSAVGGAAILAGAGAVAGTIQGYHSNYFAVRGAFAMIYAFAGAFSGAPAGYLTDFTATTVYRAP